MYENTLVTVAIEPSEIPWVKVFTKRKVKEFSQCTTAEKAEMEFHWVQLPLLLMYFHTSSCSSFISVFPYSNCLYIAK
jgi:hypothetical protein